MITSNNALDQMTIEAAIDTILLECPEFQFNRTFLDRAFYAYEDTFKALLTLSLKRAYDRAVVEFQNDYATLSELYAVWTEEYMKTGEIRAFYKAFNIKFDLLKRAEQFALWSQYHETRHTTINS